MGGGRFLGKTDIMDSSVRALGQFLDFLPEPAILIEHRDRVVAGNALAADLFGCSPAELPGARLDSLFTEASTWAGACRPIVDRTDDPSDDPSLRTRGKLQAASREALRQIECTLLRRDGRQFPVEVSHRPFQFERQSLGLAIILDVTTRKRAESELRTSEERLRQAVRVSEIGIFDHDHDTDVHYWSARQREIYGWPESEPVTIPSFLARLPPADREAIAVGIRRAHDPAGQGSFDVEHRIVRSDGEIRWIATRSITLFAGSGPERRAVRTVGASVDFTDRKHGDEGRERLAAMLDATPDFVAIFDASGSLLYLNRAAYGLLGIGPGEDLSSARVPERQPEWVVRLLAETAIPTAIRNGSWRGETAFLTREGEEVAFSQVVLAHSGSDGKVAFLSTIARDISKEKMLEAQFLQAQRMEAVGRLAGGLAHDFNNLLAVILSATALAQRDLPPEHSSQEALKDVMSAGERAAELTRRILAFSREQVFRMQTVELNEVLRGMMPMLRRLLGDLIHPAVVLDPNLGLIQADRTQLEQVILNLVVNARDAMPTGGRLTIETSSNETNNTMGPEPPTDADTGTSVRMTVSDTGVGMDAATRARLFEPYFTTKSPGRGTGLGLSMVFGIVKQSGGDIAVASELGRGTTVTVHFPCVSQRQPSRERSAPRPNDGWTPEVVLLVEDEMPLRRMIASILEQSGYLVLAAGGPREALELARAHAGHIDLLLTDIVMPDMSGKELADRLAVERPTMPVLYTTGYPDRGIVESGVLQADVCLLQKPFTLDELVGKVRKVIGGRKGRAAAQQ